MRVLSGIQRKKHDLIHVTTLNSSFSVGGISGISHQYGHKDSPSIFNPTAQPYGGATLWQ